MNINQLMQIMQARKIRLWVDDGSLRYKAPPGAFDEELKALVTEHKAALIDLLQHCQQQDVDSVIPDLTTTTGQVSFSQQRLLFMHDTFGASSAYNMPGVLLIKGQLNVAALQSSIATVMASHDALRSRFVQQHGEYHVDVLEYVAKVLTVHDVSAAANPAVAATDIIRQALAHRFDLSVAPLVCFTLVKLADDEFRLVLNVHHVISDGWSVNIIWRSIWQQYNHLHDQGPPIARPTGSYAAFVGWQQAWLNSSEYQKQQRFWLQYLQGAAGVLELPLDHSRPAEPEYQGAVVPFSIPANLCRSLRELNRAQGCSDFISLLAALSFLMFKYTGQTDISIGTPVANRRMQDWEDVVGYFANVITLRNQLSVTESLHQQLPQIRDSVLNAFEHQDFPFEKVVELLQPERSLSHSPLFQVMFIYQHEQSGYQGCDLHISETIEDTGSAKFDLTFTIKKQGDQLIGGIEYNTALFEQASVAQMAKHFVNVVQAMGRDGTVSLAELNVADADEHDQLLNQFNGPQVPLNGELLLHERILAQARQTPDRIALRDHQDAITYAELAAQVQTLALQLQGQGVSRGSLVGVSMSRGVSMTVAMLAIVYCGAAYVPLDVNFPAHRIQLICQDARLSLLVTTTEFVHRYAHLSFDTFCVDQPPTQPLPGVLSPPKVDADDLIYVIYTSGSTGNPKGVMVSHGNVVNLLLGLNAALASSLFDLDGIPTFRALTSISFDISVLELFWTLSNGFQVIIEQDHFSVLAAQRAATSQQERVSAKAKALQFSLFYFASEQESVADPYYLLKEGARFADTHGLSAVWVPERHFHSFGGQFPNPSVAAAAVSVMTRHIDIRAGSVVLPLHHPLRIAEEWSMVDNLSDGRAGIAFASGWHFNDFVLAPENFSQRHQILREGIEKVRALWAGEALSFVDGHGQPADIRIFPQPKRAELPFWVTAAANPETFRFAGSIGANVLTHFLGQSAADLSANIDLYRAARAEHGFDPQAGTVTLMLHTFLADDQQYAMNTVDKPFKDYLRNSINLLKPVAQSSGLDTEHDLEAVVQAGFQRYAKSSALFGTPARQLPLLNHLAEIGVNEIACLIDFGIEPQTVVKHLAQIGSLQQLLRTDSHPDAVVMAEAFSSHIQCTPSYAQLLLDARGMTDVLQSVKAFLVGGEALTPQLAGRINQVISGSVFNMYGPTETTVWSAVSEVAGEDASIGLPIANTQLYVLDEQMRPVPFGVVGELYIAGAGVSHGYWQRGDLTAAAFLPNPFSQEPGARIYRTGDMVRRRQDGRLHFIGRRDNQVKVRGYRIELDEIKLALERQPGIAQAAIVVQKGTQKDAAIVGYVLPDIAGSAIDTTKILTRLKADLPDYMVPSALIVMNEFPYTPNGKLDIKALPDTLPPATKKLVPAGNDTEAKIAAIWRQLLQLDEVGIHDSFFELGGHSLLLAKVQQQLEQQFALKLEIIDLFRYPTIASLAERIDENKPVQTKVTHAARALRNESANQIRHQIRQRNRRGN